MGPHHALGGGAGTGLVWCVCLCGVVVVGGHGWVGGWREVGVSGGAGTGVGADTGRQLRWGLQACLHGGAHRASSLRPNLNPHSCAPPHPSPAHPLLHPCPCLNATSHIPWP